MSGTISVSTFGESTKRKAENDLRKQLKDMAEQNGVILTGKPDIEVEEKMAGWWNGTAEQDYEVW